MKSILVIDTPSSCSECNQCDKTVFTIPHTKELYIECYAFKVEKGLMLEHKSDFKTQRHPQCSLISIDIDELEGALKEITEELEHKRGNRYGYVDVELNTIKSLIDKLKGSETK